MKKVTLLILLVLVASLLVAAIPTKMVRLTVINKSGYDVAIQLYGSAVTESYYYLQIPAGDRDVPTLRVFTIWQDVYERTTWQCNGLKSSGNLIVDGNIRLTFVPCGDFGCVGYTDWAMEGYWFKKCTGTAYAFWKRHRWAGEPRMEKVTYWKWLTYGVPSWSAAYLYGGWWNFGCGTWYWRIRTYMLPYGCQWRYQY